MLVICKYNVFSLSDQVKKKIKENDCLYLKDNHIKVVVLKRD